MINHSNENYIMDDANSPELDKKMVGRVTEDFLIVCDHLKEASYQIRSRNHSQYPVFVVSERESPVGSTFFKPSDLGTRFFYNASYFEDFLERELIGSDSEELFKEHYKDPEEFCCLFVIEAQFAGFIYIPFPND